MTAALLLTLLPFAALPAQQPIGERLVDRTLFVLNDEVLTAGKLDRRAARLAARLTEMPPEQIASLAMYTELRRMVSREGFRRMGLDESMLNRQVRIRLEDMQREDGSLARFESRLAADGFTVESMREVLREEFMYNSWLDIIAGQSPSPTRGLRQLPEPTAEEIRVAYEATPEQWEEARVIEWVSLSFLDGGEDAALEAARDMRARLARGEATLEEALAACSNSREQSGDPAALSLRRDLIEFLEDAWPGDVGPVDVIRGLGGQFVVLRERRDPRSISFAEAQVLVRQQLMYEREVQAELRELLRLVDSSYTWIAEDLEGYIAQMRIQAGSGDPEEL